MSDQDDFDFASLERRRTRELEEGETRRRERRAVQRAELRRAHRRRRAILLAAVALVVTVLVGAWSMGGGHRRVVQHPPAAAVKTPATARTAATAVRHMAMPLHVHGLHLGLYVPANGGLNRFVSLVNGGGVGLNTIEVDVKDERGEVGFTQGVPALARHIGAARDAYDASALVREAHAAGLYVIGRIVCFEDPLLAHARPSLAIRTVGGGIWTNGAGLGWTNEYDPRVWNYLIGLGKAAARHGFDEIQFDYMRFPTDGNVADAVWPHRRAEPLSTTLLRFLTRAREQLKPLGVNISADVFGLAANRDLGIGQNVHKLAPELDAISPMSYPTHYGPGEYGIPNPVADPYDIVYRTMGDFRAALAGTHTQLRPWLEDFVLPSGAPAGLAHVLAQIRAAERGGASGWLLWNAESLYTDAALTTS